MDELRQAPSPRKLLASVNVVMRACMHVCIASCVLPQSAMCLATRAGGGDQGAAEANVAGPHAAATAYNSGTVQPWLAR